MQSAADGQRERVNSCGAARRRSQRESAGGGGVAEAAAEAAAGAGSSDVLVRLSPAFGNVAPSPGERISSSTPIASLLVPATLASIVAMILEQLRRDRHKVVLSKVLLKGHFSQGL